MYSKRNVLERLDTDESLQKIKEAGTFDGKTTVKDKTSNYKNLRGSCQKAGVAPGDSQGQ